MLAPRPGAKKHRSRKAKLNKSSRTKTVRQNRKQDKQASTVKQFEHRIEKMIVVAKKSFCCLTEIARSNNYGK